MKIGVTGAQGRLGSELVRQGCLPLVERVGMTHLHREIDSINPDIIIHCAAMTNVDKCEDYPYEASLNNVVSTKSLTNYYSGKIVYISTDYIFDGQDGPYSEIDKPSPISIYGWSKLGGEIVVKNASSDNLIIRTTVLFDKYSDNFVTSVARQLHISKHLFLPDNLYGSPTYVPYLTKGIIQAIQYGLTGILNITGNQVMNRYQLGRKIAGIMGKHLDLVLPTDEIKGLARRPLKAGLLTNKAKELGISIYNPIDGVKEVINALEAMDYRRPDNDKSDSLEWNGNRVFA